MVPTEPLCQLLEQIVLDALPNEKLAWDLEGRAITKELCDQGEVDIEKPLNGGRHAVSEAVEALKFVGVLLATIRTIREFVQFIRQKQAHRVEEKAIRERWLTALREKGLSRESSEEIVDKFVPDLGRVIGTSTP
ncbi:MAG: hypothetical protein GY778_26385 [bacterium]|nr:hypothetical protein [bacterium]